MEKWNKKFKILMLVIEGAMIVSLVFGCIALKDAIVSRAATPYIDGRTGEWVYLDGQQEDAIDIPEAPPINRISEALDDVDANGRRMEYLGEFKITYYCPCGKCNGYDKHGNPRSYDRYGNPLVWGTVAVDPKVIPLQTHLVIDGYDMEFVARDTGGDWVQGNHIDMFVPVSHSEALAMPNGSRVKVWRYVER